MPTTQTLGTKCLSKCYAQQHYWGQFLQNYEAKPTAKALKQQYNFLFLCVLFVVSLGLNPSKYFHGLYSKLFYFLLWDNLSLNCPIWPQICHVPASACRVVGITGMPPVHVQLHVFVLQSIEICFIYYHCFFKIKDTSLKILLYENWNLTAIIDKYIEYKRSP